MKKFILIGLCLFMGLTLSRTYGQNNGTKTVQGWIESQYWSPVFCDGVLVDVLEGGTIRLHYVAHYKDGKFQWETDQLKGEVTSYTGEVFRIREIDKYYIDESLYLTWHFNLIGDMGTHYIGSLTYSYATNSITINKSVCH